MDDVFSTKVSYFAYPGFVFFREGGVSGAEKEKGKRRNENGPSGETKAKLAWAVHKVYRLSSELKQALF